MSSATDNAPTSERKMMQRYMKAPLSISAYTRRIKEAAMATRLRLIENIKANLSTASQLQSSCKSQHRDPLCTPSKRTGACYKCS